MSREPTEFEASVYEVLCKVPHGRLVTYKMLGDAIGCESSQAIGNALRRNPNAPEVPCHRVITALLKIGGYMGEVDGERVERKLKLLESEGVTFDVEGNLIDPSCLLDSVPE